ncbi:CDR2 protein, partial [Amia calva]|nr:CDR2 protein [Amia calva]
MYSTNQEQLQEIEYLSKQVDLLRQMNEQHAKVYEQLDVTARDLELTNQRLVLDNRSSQQKIMGLAETIDTLQTQVEDLQRQVEELKAPRREERTGRDLAEQRRSSTAQSVSCLKELYDMRKYFVYDHVFAERIVSGGGERSEAAEEENGALRRSVAALQAQLGTERERREAAEQEAELIARENSELERRLEEMEACRGRVRELEGDVEELRQICRSGAEAAFASRVEKLVPDSVFFSFPERELERVGEAVAPESEAESPDSTANPESEKRSLKRCSSESGLRGATADDIRRGHERTCIRRAEAVKQRGISLLNEVDAQYSALQVKYEELLRRCQLGEDGLSHKAVQTGRRSSRAGPPLPSPSGCPQGAHDTSVTPEGQQPEYKALFQEIFTCIQKTKEDLSENRNRGKLSPSQPQ